MFKGDEERVILKLLGGEEEEEGSAGLDILATTSGATATRNNTNSNSANCADYLPGDPEENDEDEEWPDCEDALDYDDSAFQEDFGDLHECEQFLPADEIDNWYQHFFFFFFCVCIYK
jgi:hypothetical protein